MIQFLFESGARWRYPNDKMALTALDHAIRNGDKMVAEYLIEKDCVFAQEQSGYPLYKWARKLHMHKNATSKCIALAFAITKLRILDRPMIRWVVEDFADVVTEKAKAKLPPKKKKRKLVRGNWANARLIDLRPTYNDPNNPYAGLHPDYYGDSDSL